MDKTVKCGKLNISNKGPFTLIAGPCQLENEKHALTIANDLKKIGYESGEELGKKLKLLEKEWLENNFVINENLKLN